MVGNEKSKDQEMETDQMSQMGKLGNNWAAIGQKLYENSSVRHIKHVSDNNTNKYITIAP